MKLLPKGWRVHDGRNPEQELRRLKRRFMAITQRFERPIKFRRLLRSCKVPALILLGAAVLWSFLVLATPWPPLTALKHFAASANCDTARAVGLAPAKRGQPGYWQRNDGDNDGIACEPYPRH